MRDKTETEVKKEITDYLKACGYKVYRMQAGRISKNMHNNEAGTPDLLAVGKHGYSVWCEIKKPGGRLSSIQIDRLAELVERGQNILVADCVDDVARYLP